MMSSKFTRILPVVQVNDTVYFWVKNHLINTGQTYSEYVRNLIRKDINENS